MYSSQLTASGSTLITWTFSGNLPEVLMMDTTGLISGTPSKKGRKKIIVTVANSYGSAMNAEKEFFLTIKAEEPQITTKALPDVLINTLYTAQLEAEDTPTIT